MPQNPYLTGNFAPVQDETTAFDLPVTGEIPRDLRGRLLRIGPNPLDPDPATHHWFLGNGLVHGVRLEDGQAKWYRSRLVRDDEVVRLRGGDPVPGPANQGPGGGIANTNVIGHAGRTFAIVEAGGWPVELSDELETLSRSDFDGTLPRGFTAHPKVDPDTGEMHAACYSPFDENVQYLVVGADGRVRRRVDVPLPHKPMIHDCAITERYFLVLDFPCVFDAQALTEGQALPYRWHPELPARVGLLPRDGEAGDIVWCEIDPCYVFHPMNAYDDADGRVVLDVARHPAMFATHVNGPDEGPPVLERWRLDPQGGPIKAERVDDRAQEFPRIDDRLAGKPYRYGYAAAIDPGFEARALLKHDMKTGTAESHAEGAHRTFFEPVFVPARDGAGEDEGYVMAYVHDAERGAADVVILDADDFAGEPIATVRLPARVPYGFHGNWVADD
jgi:carotenoid cleavage dioxygenase